ncbi:nuclease-related domain-containing DEAD/DEAH box helicase [Herbaspirillum sp.]|uniref:nuclease-related domain-containing DEAD/DEAH box helicase n=1 Tax=Herbaspirillum sp. TaxID=1890675 RepID=UPI002D781099|nr:ATP-binding domain-containing protein [Herbaspirillum sp.]
MALVKPSPGMGAAQGSGRYRELAVLQDLARGLPDGFEVFHSVFVHNSDGQADDHCEIDVVVMAPDGRLLLMEIKAGGVIHREGRLYKSYGGHEHDVDRQCLNQYMAMVRRLSAAGLRTDLTRCLVLPDHVLTKDQIVSMPQVRIIDAHGYAHLAERVRAMLEAPASGRALSDAGLIRQFMDNQFDVLPDLTVIGRQLRDATMQLADGLASWVPRIQAPSRVLRVQATAGSGKTQLALRLIGGAVAAGKAVLYVCFNRSLADHMIRLASPRATIASFHELSIAHFQRHHGTPDFSDHAVFDKAADAYIADSAGFDARYDVLLVDEAQDFEHAWLRALFYLLREDGLLYVMEDEQQQLYQRDPFDIDDAVVIRSRDNFRSPREICRVINALGLADETIISRSPYGGSLPTFYTYADDESLPGCTEQAVQAMLAQGFAPADIVVLTARGRQRSRLSGLVQLAGQSVRRFEGEYDRDGNACWREGQLLVESIYRFKGQSARAVVLTELDFTTLSARERALLFVGMTRATMAASLVMTAATEQLLARQLEPANVAAVP